MECLEAVRAARELLEDITPLNQDCGRFCGGACCQCDEDGQGGMLLFPEEEALYSPLPEGFSIPEGRKKPWGTGHAVLCCRGVVDGPFAVINADDFYGAGAYKAMYDFLSGSRKQSEYAMVGYRLRNTVTENGSVARGVCDIENGYLVDITERTHIEKHGEVIAFTEDGESYTPLPADVPVSMNSWAFSNSMLDELYKRFPAWLDANLPVNPTKCEYFLPFVTNAMIKDGEGTVAVLPCHEQWYGMTYKEDFPTVVNAIKALREDGVYPEKLLD